MRLSFPGIGEGKSIISPVPGDAIVSRVPVVSANGIPLMPCKSAKARKLIESGETVKISKTALRVINSADEPLETKEVEERVNKIIKNSTRTKLFYRLNSLRAEGLIKGKFIGPSKGVWIWWKKDMFENKR
jgi:hypothetical protein